MSTTIDQRVVQMQFDNAQFEAGVQQTLNSLNRLNDSIEKNTANTGKAAFGNIGHKLDFSNLQFAKMGTALDTLKSKFSVLGTAADQFTRNLTTKLQNAAWSMTKTLTGIDSMTEGFNKFNQKTSAVSTLMTATGASMKDVTATLEDLAWFTDQTSYNFTDMIDTMSKMTASGEKDLGKLLRFTEGFALAAAKAGVGAEKTSHAMYQLTQAASRGYIQYQDWQQALGTTNIATADLKQRMIEAGGEAAVAAGAYDDFNSSLKKGWLTIDVFADVMDDFTQGINKANYDIGEDGFTKSCTGAADSTTKFSEEAFRCAQECRTWDDVVNAVKDSLGTGWSDSFTYILGDTKEVKALFTGLANAAINVGAEISEWRNNLLKGWKDLGGRMDLIKIMVNLLNALKSVIEPIRRAFAEVFGELTPKSLKGATGSLEAFTRGLILTSERMTALKNVFIDVFTVIKKGFDFARKYAKLIINFLMITTLLKSIRSLFLGGLGLNTITSLIKIFITWGLLKRLNNVQNGANLLGKALGGVADVLGVIGKKIQGNKVLNTIATVLRVIIRLAIILVAAIVKGISTVVAAFKSGNIGKTILAFFTTIGSKIKEFFTSLADNKAFGKFGANAKNAFEVILGVLASLGSKIKEVFTNLFSHLDFSKTMWNTRGIGKKILDALAGAFRTVRSNLSDLMKELSGKSFLGKIQTIGSAIVKVFQNAFEKIKSFNALSKLKSLGTDVGKLFEKLFASISGAKITDKIKSFFTTLGSLVQSAMTKVLGTNVTTKITNFFKGIWNLLKAIGMTIKEFASGIKLPDFDLTGFKKISDGAKEANDNVKTLGNSFKKFSVKDFFGSGLMKEGDGLKGASASLIGLVDTIKKASTDINKASASMFSGFGQASKNVAVFGNVFGTAGDKVTNFFKALQQNLEVLQETNPIIRSIVGFLTKVDWQKVLMIGYLIAYIAIMKRIDKAVTSVGTTITNMGKTLDTLTGNIHSSVITMIDSITSLNKAIGSVPTSISKYIDSMTKSNKYRNFRDLAIGIGLLAGSLALICMLPVDRLGTAVKYLAAVVGMAAGTVALIGVISKIANPKAIYALIAAMTVFDASLLELSVLLGIIAGITAVVIGTSKDMNDAMLKLEAPFQVLAELLIAMLGSLGVIAALSPMIDMSAIALLKMAGALAALGGSMLLLSVSLSATIGMLTLIGAELRAFANHIIKVVSSMDPAELIGVIVVLAATITGLLLVGHLAVKALTGITMKIVAAIGMLALSFISLAVAVKILSTVSDGVINGIIGLMGAFLILGGAINFLAAPTFKEAGDNMKKLGSAMLKMSVSILILVGAIALLGKMDPVQMFQGLSAVAGMMLIMGLAAKLMEKANIKGVAAAILALVISLYLLVPIIALFSLSWKAMLPGIIEVSALMLTMAKAIQWMSQADPKKLIPILATMGIVVTVLGVIITELAKLPIDSVAVSAASLSLVMLAFGGAVKMMQSVFNQMTTNYKGWYRSIIMFVTIVGTFGVVAALLGQVLHSLASIGDWSSVLAAGVSLSMAMLAFAGAIAIMTNVIKSVKNISKFIPTMIVSIGMMSVVALALFQAISVIGKLPWQQALAASAGISLAMLALAGAVAIMTTFTQTVPVTTLLGLSVVIVALSGGLSLLAVAMTQLAAVPFANILAFLIPMVAGLTALTAVLGVFGPALTAAVPAILSIAAVIGVLCAGMSLLAVAMSQLAAVPMGNILAFLIPFVAGMVALTAVIGIFGPTLLVATPAIFAFAAALSAMAAIVTAVGNAAVMFGVAANLIATAIARLNASMVTTIPTITKFLQAMQELSALQTLKMAAAIATMGVALIPFAAGLTAAGLAAAIAGRGLEVAAKGVTALATAIKAAQSTITKFTTDAKTWGQHIGSNLASGLGTGVRAVGQAARNLAYQIWYQLHQSNGEAGSLLHNVAEWGVHIWQNISGGLSSGTSFLGAAAKKLGSFVKKGFSDGTEGTGLASLKKLGSELASGETSIDGILQSLGLSGGNAFGSGLLSGASGWISKLNSLQIGGGKPTVKYSGKNKSGYAWKEGGSGDAAADEWSDMDWFSADDFLNASDDVDGLTDSFTNLGGAADDAAGSTGGAGSAASDAAEEARKLAKFIDYSQKVIKEFTNSWGNLTFMINDTTPIENAENAFADLAEKIYADSLNGEAEDATMTAEERAGKIREAFIQAFEDIKNSAKDALNGFEKFDRGLADAMTPDEMISNVKDRFEGVQTFYERLQHLAYKGFSDDIIKDLLEEGTSAYPKVSSMLKMTTEQVEELNSAYKDKDVIATQSAVMGMVARMTALELPKLKERAGAVAGLNNELINQGLAYKQLEESGLASTETLTQAQEDLTTMAEKSGMTFEQLQEVLKDTDAVQAALAVNSINSMEDAYDAMQQIKDGAEQIKEGTKSAFESAMNIFSEWDESKWELTGDKLLSNMQSQIAGIGRMAANLGTVIKNGGSVDLVVKLANEGAEAVAAAAQWSVSQVQEANGYIEQSLTTPTNQAEYLAQMYMQYGQANGMTYAQALQQFTEAQANIGGLQAAGANLAQSLAQGTESGIESSAQKSASRYAQLLKTSVEGQTETVKSAGTSMGQALTEGTTKGIDDTKENVATSATNAVTDASNKANDSLNDGSAETIGQNWTVGVANGMGSQYAMNAVASAVDNVTSTVKNRTANGLDEHSPSKLSAKYGRFWNIGLANGIVKTVSEVANATDSVTNIVVDSMVGAMDAANEALSSSDNQPTITPVLDMSNIGTDSALLGEQFATPLTMAVNPQLGQITTQTDQLNRSIAGIDVTPDNRDILSALNGLSSRINDLGYQMKNMQVVLDSGTLVGEITPQVDSSLGKIYNRRNR